MRPVAAVDVELNRVVGLPILVGGFLLGSRLRLPVSLIVLTAGVATGLGAGMPLVGTAAKPGIIDGLGKTFVDSRTITLFVLCLPAIGLCERHGLQERARALIRSLRALTVGRLQFLYQVCRVGIVALGLRMGSGHVSFSRPIILPMSLGAAGTGAGDPPDPARPTGEDDRPEMVKSAVGASENYANFFGQNLFPASAGVAIILKTLESGGHHVDAIAISRWMIPVAVASLIVGLLQYRMLDRWLARPSGKG